MKICFLCWESKIGDLSDPSFLKPFLVEGIYLALQIREYYFFIGLYKGSSRVYPGFMTFSYSNSAFSKHMSYTCTYVISVLFMTIMNKSLSQKLCFYSHGGIEVFCEQDFIVESLGEASIRFLWSLLDRV